MAVSEIWGKHRNPSQDGILLEFMRKHPDMARNFTRGDRVAVSAAWADLAVKLNSVGPPIKNADEWRNVWKDWKLAIKKKITHNKRESKATGGGPFNQVALNPTEEEIAQLCHMFEAVDGVAGARTFGILLPNNEKENAVEEEAVEVNICGTTDKR
ncbi:hypothetical protein ACLKA7_001884 [Drosophila subpalustris]